MLVPVLISYAFRPPSKRGFTVEKKPEKQPREIVFELSELLPEINETIELALLYLNSLEESKGDSMDISIARAVRDLQELRSLLQKSKTRGIMSIVEQIRKEIFGIPKLITRLMFHSRLPGYQTELSEIRIKYEELVHHDSLLRDELTFIRAYCKIRWKGAEALKTQTTAKVHETIKK